MFLGRVQSGNSSEDAKMFAPCFRTAEKSSDCVFCADIVLSMSAFLCLIICIISVLGLLDIIGIIILSIIIIGRHFLRKERTVRETF